MSLAQDQASLTADRFAEVAKSIESEVGKIIVGQKQVVRQTLIAIIAGGHVLLEGVPGLGKTVLVRSLGSALGLRFSRVQFTPDLMPSDITGTHIVTESEEGRRRFDFQPGPLFTNLLLADEINRATPKTQSALLEAMQEQQVTVGNDTRPLPRPFFVLATQNPIELEGTYPLPEAQLDRFFFKLVVSLPGLDDLVEVAERTTGVQEAALSPVAGGRELLEMGRLARQVPAAGHVVRYAGRLVLATHPESEEAPDEVKRYVKWGSSPRGLQSIILAARIGALLDGRFNVAAEDVVAAAVPALRHRVFLNYEASAAGVSAEDVLDSVLTKIRAEQPALS